MSTVAEELLPPERLAVAYAPVSARPAWIGLLALDRRLARVALAAREPMLAQLRLAWWRDRFRAPAGDWPAGEPLLAVLAAWEGERAALERLVDGWEGAIGGEADEAALAALVAARAGAVAALARVVGVPPSRAIEDRARHWAAASLPAPLNGRVSLGTTAVPPLPRAMRPLAVLAGLADGQASGPGRVRALGRIIRLGLTGR
ncbi:MAG: squalene/phytoene synthase family protein [Novosphingobium sp.]